MEIKILINKDYDVPTTEKASVNINIASLSHIDMLVDAGYYSNRSDFVNQAIREKLQQQQHAIENAEKMMKEKNGAWLAGIWSISKKELEEMYKEHRKISINGYGVVSISKECDPKMVYEVIKSIHVHGKLICSEEIKAHYMGADNK